MGHLKAAIFDISKTTLDDNNRLQPGMDAVLHQFQAWGIEVFFASNRREVCGRVQQLLNVPEERLIHYYKVNRVGKGSGAFVRFVSSQLAIDLNNIIYLGDDQVDMQESVNNDVILFLAQWTGSTLPYGIPVQTPAQFLQTLETFFLKDTLWYYQFDENDLRGRPVTCRALIDYDGAYRTGIRLFLKTKGSQGAQQINGYSTLDFISLHLLASMYFEGLHLRGGRGGSVWCMWPNHDGTYTNALSAFSYFVSRLFRDRYYEDLIIRHTPSISSHEERGKGNDPPITNQLQTIHLNAAHVDTIQGKNVIVLDDFTTKGYGFETARNMLLTAGASSVTSIAVGKFGRWYAPHVPREGVTWDNFAPNNLTADDFEHRFRMGRFESDALKYF